jgi:hypothetical protein
MQIREANRLLQKGCLLLLALSLLAASGLPGPNVAAQTQDGAPFVLIPRISSDQEEAIVRAFVERNPTVPWVRDLLLLDPWSGWVSRAVAPPPESPTGPTDADAAKSVAADFLRRNADLLGIPEAVIPGLTIEHFADGGPGETGMVQITSSAPISYPGYTSLGDFGYLVDLQLSVAGSTVITAINNTNRLPDFAPLKTVPSVEPDAPTIVDQLVGKELFFSDFAGEDRSAGRIERGDIGQPTLTVESLPQEDHRLWIGLIWKYEIQRGGLPWTFIFSAHTGELLLTDQAFQT